MGIHIALAALLAGQAATAPADSRVLAGKHLPADVAAKVVSHEVHESPLAGSPPMAVSFRARAEPISPRICRRDVFYVSLPRAGEGQRPVVTAVELAVAARCDVVHQERFVRLQPASAERSAVHALQWLARAINAAARGRAVVHVTCANEIQAGGCRDRPLRILASLSLANAYLMEPIPSVEGAAPETWRVAIRRRPLRPGEPPGQPFWQVTFAPTDLGKGHVALTFTGPAPF